MLLIIDNYDSFTYNLVQYLGEAGVEMRVVLNDGITVDSIDDEIRPTRILISPGPGAPADAGISLDVIARFAGRCPILGVCLGHQAIAMYLGAQVKRAKAPVHGKASTITHDGRGVFVGLPESLKVGRYHSLAVERETTPPDLEVAALSADGVIMGLRNERLQLHGVQFHPESILTEHGKKILHNFVRL